MMTESQKDWLVWSIQRDVTLSPPLPANVAVLVKKLDSLQSWQWEDALTIMDMAHRKPFVIETLWRWLSGGVELNDQQASKLLATLVEEAGE